MIIIIITLSLLLSSLYDVSIIVVIIDITIVVGPQRIGTRGKTICFPQRESIKGGLRSREASV